MKKALITTNLAGFSAFLINDIKYLQEIGYQVYFASNGTTSKEEPMLDELNSLGVVICQADFDSKNPFSRSNIAAYRQIRKLIKQHHFDLIHCHTPITGLITRLAALPARRKNTKVIYTTHGFAFVVNKTSLMSRVYKAIESLGALMCDAMITINREDYSLASKMHCKKVYYIHGVGVDTKEYQSTIIDRNAYRESLGIDSDKTMILSVGELSVRKNHQIIIRALAKLPDKEKYVYVVCGKGINGGTGDSLMALAKELNVDLRLPGFRRDIPQIIACSDLGAIPSIREGLGLAGIESLSAGIPLVGTDVQGIRDYIIEGKTGILCGAFDENAYAEAIASLTKMDAAQRQAMQEHCYEVAQLFDVNHSKQEMKNIYQEILNHTPSGV